MWPRSHYRTLCSSHPDVWHDFGITHNASQEVRVLEFLLERGRRGNLAKPLKCGSSEIGNSCSLPRGRARRVLGQLRREASGPATALRGNRKDAVFGAQAFLGAHRSLTPGCTTGTRRDSESASSFHSARLSLSAGARPSCLLLTGSWHSAWHVAGLQGWTVVLNQGDSAPQGTWGTVWRHSGLSHCGRGGEAKVPLKLLQCTGRPRLSIQPQMPILPSAGHHFCTKAERVPGRGGDGSFPGIVRRVPAVPVGLGVCGEHRPKGALTS